MSNSSFVQSVVGVTPPHEADNAAVLAAAEGWLGGRPELLERFSRFVNNSSVRRRYFLRPAAELLLQGSQRDRSEDFFTHGLPLVERAAREALEQAAVAAESIGAVVFTSCTYPLIPSLDALVIERLGVRPDVVRVPIYQQGCAGGAVGLALADRLAGAAGPVLLLSLELCSLLFYREDITPSQLVGAAIFADGAAASVLSGERGPVRIKAARSQLVPGSNHLMGYDILADGPHLRLLRELPSAVGEHVERIVGEFLAAEGLASIDVRWWLFHPGGEKILGMLEHIFSLRSEQAEWSRRVLAQFGNMSSASVLFVLREFLQDAVGSPGERALLLGIGPGVTLELLLLEL